MIYAYVEGEKCAPTPGARGLCPGCSAEVLAKCGQINEWHWSHMASDCDPWYEPESIWHWKWKDRWAREQQEVVIGPHRADVQTHTGLVIEFQASSISPQEIEEREAFYGKMIWVLNGDKFKRRLKTKATRGPSLYLWWKHGRKCWRVSNRPIFIDLGEGILLNVTEFHKESRKMSGWANYLTVNDFMDRYGTDEAHRRRLGYLLPEALM